MEKKKKILLIDDEKDTHGPFKMRLEEQGYEVLTADGGLEAWEMIKKEKPDLLILDIRMPKLNGEELLQRLRDEGVSPATQVIISTGVSDYGRTKDRILKNFSVACYLEKPIVVKELLEKVRSVLSEGSEVA